MTPSHAPQGMMRYFFINGLYLNAGGAAQAACSLVTAVVLARYLPKESLGAYSFTLAALGMLSITALAGRSLIIQDIAKGSYRNYRIALRNALGRSFLGALALMAAATYWTFESRTDLGITFFAAGILFPAYAVSSFYLYYFSGKKRFREIGLYTTFFSLVTAASLMTALFSGGDWQVLVLVFMLATLCTGGIATAVAYARIPESAPLDIRSIALTNRISALDALETAVFYLDNILVGAFLGFEKTATYAVAKTIPEQIKGVVKTVGEISVPELCEWNDARIKKDFLRKFWQFTGILALVASAYALAAPAAYATLFPRYTDSVAYSQFFSLSLISLSLVFIGNLFQIRLMKRELTLSRTSAIVLQSTLLFTLIPAYGLAGAIAARVIGRFFLMGMNITLFKRVFETSSDRQQ